MTGQIPLLDAAAAVAVWCSWWWCLLVWLGGLLCGWFMVHGFSLTCALDIHPHRRSWVSRPDCRAPPYYRDRSLFHRHRHRRVSPCCRDRPPHHSRSAAVATGMAMAKASGQKAPDHVRSPCCSAISILASWV